MLEGRILIWSTKTCWSGDLVGKWHALYTYTLHMGGKGEKGGGGYMVVSFRFCTLRMGQSVLSDIAVVPTQWTAPVEILQLLHRIYPHKTSVNLIIFTQNIIFWYNGMDGITVTLLPLLAPPPSFGMLDVVCPFQYFASTLDKTNVGQPHRSYALWKLKETQKHSFVDYLYSYILRKALQYGSVKTRRYITILSSLE